jgi:hypothetical protein
MMNEKKSSADRRRERYQNMSPEEKAALLERNRQWREQWRKDHPAEYEAQKKRKAAKWVEKYRADPEFRQHRQAYLRERYNASPSRRRPSKPEQKDPEPPGPWGLFSAK